MTFEVRYAAPPAFVSAWLTDYRPDDGKRWFDFEKEGSVVRTAGGFRLEGPFPWLGRSTTDVTLDSATHWSADVTIVNSRGRPLYGNHTDEILEPDGNGTRQTVRIWVRPESLGARLISPFMVFTMRRRLARGFQRMKIEIESEFGELSRRDPAN
jgi:hypothetical protein